VIGLQIKLVREALARQAGRIRPTARELGISHTHVQRLLRLMQTPDG